MLNVKLVIKYANGFLIKPLTYKDNTGHVMTCISIQDLQLLHQTDQVLTLLPDMTVHLDGQLNTLTHPKLKSYLS